MCLKHPVLCREPSSCSINGSSYYHTEQESKSIYQEHRLLAWGNAVLGRNENLAGRGPAALLRAPLPQDNCSVLGSALGAFPPSFVKPLQQPRDRGTVTTHLTGEETGVQQG